MINLVIFIISFIAWLVLIIKRNYSWYTYVLYVVWGFFFAQSILYLTGQNTIIP